MTQGLRYGLLGCGMMGQEHVRNISLLPDASVTAILEPDAGMRAAAAALAPDARLVERLEDLLDAEIDALVIASPNHFHAEQIAAVARIRPLPLMTEKPVCTTLDEARRLEAACADYPAPFWVAMEYRYMPPIARLIAEAQARTGGIRMLSIREHRYPFLDKVGAWNRFDRLTGGTLVEKCCHFFDLMCHILRDRPVRVFASAAQDANHKDEVYDGAAPDVIDNAYVVLDFAGGARAMLDLCMFAEGARYQEEIAATGPLGRIEALAPGPTRFWPEATLGAAPPPQVIVSPRAPKGPLVLEIPIDPALLAAGDHNGATFYQHVRFAAAIRGEGPVEVGLADGLREVRIGLAARRSALTGQAVDLRDGPYA
ncbi:MAG: Gfo/Idh/MocA family oxidoreductase [Rhodobacteraceae bacterium]|nr:Gfo/Idh/MocA family oxidoreductase [Paracoccaceae bacterium]